MNYFKGGAGDGENWLPYHNRNYSNLSVIINVTYRIIIVKCFKWNIQDGEKMQIHSIIVVKDNVRDIFEISIDKEMDASIMMAVAHKRKG